MPEKNNHRDQRLILLSTLFLLIGGLLATKLFFVQVVNGEDYRQEAERRYERPKDQVFARGNIYFSNRDGKLVSAATVKSGYTLILNPSRLKTATSTYETLSKIIKLDETDFYYRASKQDDPHEELADELSLEEGGKISALNLMGIELTPKSWRFYPGGNLAAHVLGLVGYDGNNHFKSGRYGLEKEYENVLRKNEQTSFSNFLGHILLGLPEEKSSPESGDIITTIEPAVQRFLEHELETIKETWGSKLSGAIVMDPRTGAIIAMAANPTFDPGGKQTNLEHLANPLVERVYEVGSIIKPITMASGLDAGVINQKSTYNDQGYISLDNRIISNYDQRGRGWVPMQEILNQSLNTGAVYIMQKLGSDLFIKYFSAFGLIGEKTGIDLPSEQRGLADNLKSRRAVEYATASFGQGIAITPLSAATALSVIANQGRLVKPYVVKEIIREDKTRLVTQPEIKAQVISEATASTTKEMLVRVVDEALLGGKERLTHYQVGAKTGTAQVRDPQGGYYPDRYLHSFFGFFPASEPRFTVFLYTLEPQGAEYASGTLTTPFFNIAKFLINYYQIPPDR